MDIKHNEEFPSGRLPLNLLRQGYEAEITSLMTIARSAHRDVCFSHIANYAKYIESIKKNKNTSRADGLPGGNSIIYFEKNEQRLLAAALTAHVAICCELLDGLNIPLSLLTQESALPLTERIFSRFNNLEEDLVTRDSLEMKLHSIDAFRTLQILRGMGLFIRPTKNIHQLSLGAGSAKKDIKSIHLAPRITVGPANTISFKVTEEHAGDIVIVDGDPSRKSAYAQLNSDPTHSIYAINNDAMEALSELPQIQSNNKFKQRNTIIALRIDHRMLPDVAGFFRELSKSIDANADLVITIGAGFDIHDFTGRVTVMGELHDYLKSIGLLPVLIKLHGRGTLEEQWNSQSFGLKFITTYQILYCKLERNKLI